MFVSPKRRILQIMKEPGRSLLDLSDLDRLRNPAYFHAERKTRGGDGHNKVRKTEVIAKSKMTSTNSKPVQPLEKNITRSKSETSLHCERF